MSTALPSDLQQFVAQELAAGHYASEEELVASAVRRLRDNEERIREIKDEIQRRIDSLDRGEGVELNSDEEMEQYLDDIWAEAYAKVDAEKKRTA